MMGSPPKKNPSYATEEVQAAKPPAIILLKSSVFARFAPKNKNRWLRQRFLFLGVFAELSVKARSIL